jgi:membrane peptidoglycan carboxypeptidase
VTHDDIRPEDRRHGAYPGRQDVPAPRVPRHDTPAPSRRRHASDETADHGTPGPGAGSPGYGGPTGYGPTGRHDGGGRHDAAGGYGGPAGGGAPGPDWGRRPGGDFGPPVPPGPPAGHGPGPAADRYGQGAPGGDRSPHAGPSRYGQPADPGPYGPGRESNPDPYDGDRTDGLFGGGYGGRPGSTAEARAALQNDHLIAGQPGGPGGPRGPRGRGPGGGGDGQGPGKRRRRLKKIAKIGGIASVVLLILGIASVGLIYVRTDVPDPRALETNQVATIYYAGGKAELARVGSQNRSDVPLTKIPEHVRWAVLAAENRSFYSDPGISPKGIARAALNNLKGGDLQGGSTITQQYVKNVFTDGDRNFQRKFKELFVTVKLDKQYSKDQILEWYLNTIYFGRGAYGIQAASLAYFGKPITRLTIAEGAVLASTIRSPALYDPSSHPERAKDRWTFVLNGMVTMGKLSKADADKQKYPKVRKKTNGTLDDVRKTWKGHIVDQVLDELETADFDLARLNSEGLRIVTTIDKKAQESAVSAVTETFSDQKAKDPKKQLRQALTAVDPQTGRVLAYWGGPDGTGFDYAQAWRQAGSSFKPFVLAAALQQTLDPETPDDKKISVYKTYDGSSPRTFLGQPVRNSEGAQCNPCSVLDAMRRSINTVFYEMAIETGPVTVAGTAHKLGIPTKRTDNGKPTLQTDGNVEAGISIGAYEVRAIDQATAFGTLASGGTLHPTHFVEKVIDVNGQTVWEHEDKPKQVIDSKVANDVTYAMKPVAAASDDPLADGRESAAKTGTQQYLDSGRNSDAWMVGYTPKVSAAVWVGTNDLQGMETVQGGNVYGRGLPGKTWQAFMNKFLAGTPQDELTDQVQVNPTLRPVPTYSKPPMTSEPPKPTMEPTRPKPTTPSPTPTPTATETPTPTPTPTGSGSPTPSATRTRPGVPLPPGVGG